MATSARRRERRPRSQRAAYPPIRSFADAVCAAFALHSQFDRARVCFVLGANGKVEQGWALTGPEHDEGHVLALAMCGPDRELSGRSVLLVTTRGDDAVCELVEDDVATWRRLEADVAARGARLVDWILVGGRAGAPDEAIRSMRFATDPTAVDTWEVS
ncbi:MAG TPA: hypothetical protein VFA83_06930 [Acidimicrobiales bacterium]|nr:hypothetical protein [Acidimicrobiales bacterium]